MKLRVMAAMALLAFSAVPQAGGSVWTIDRSVNMAIKQSNNIARKQLDKDKAQTDARITGKRWNPSITLDANANFVSEIMEISIPFKTITFGDYDSYSTALNIRQLIYDGGRIKNLTEASLSRAKMEKMLAEAEVLATEFRARHTFFTIIMAEDLCGAAETSIDEARRHLDDIQALKRQGMALETDLLSARLRITQAEMKYEEQKAILETARAEFRQLLGLESGETVELSRKSDSIPEIIEPSAKKAFERRPEYSAFQAAITASEKTARHARASRRPTITLTGSAHYGRPGLDMPANDWMHYFSGGLYLSWNVWDWGKASDKSLQAEIDKRKTERRINDLERSIKKDLEAAIADHSSLVKRRDLSKEADIVAQQKLALITASFREGASTENEYNTAHAEYTKALYESSAAETAVAMNNARIIYILGLSSNTTGGSR